MSTLMVIMFKNESGAGEMIAEIQALQKKQALTIADAATLVRRQDGKIQIKQVNSLVGAGALGGAFWGMFTCRLFWNTWSQAQPGGDFTETTACVNCGLDVLFIQQIRHTVQSGHSALFMLVEIMDKDMIIASLSRWQARWLATTLSIADEIKLREAFGAVESNSI